MTTSPAPRLAPAPVAAQTPHLRAIYRSEYRHWMHDADQDSSVPAFVVSLTKTGAVAK